MADGEELGEVQSLFRPALAAGAMHLGEHLITSDQFLIYRRACGSMRVAWHIAVGPGRFFPCPTRSGGGVARE